MTRPRPGAGALMLAAAVLALAAACGDGDGTDPAAGEDGGARPRVGDHWHAAFAINICGVEQNPLPDAGPDAGGIHSHTDGLIHIHPFDAQYAGQNATLGVFLDQIGVEVDQNGIRTASGGVEVADQGCDGEAARVAVAWWEDADAAVAGADPDEVFTEDFDDVRLESDGAACTVAFLPEGEPIPAPSSADQVDNPTDV